MNRYDAALLDLDGTLIDSAPGVLGCIEQTLAHFGKTATPEALYPCMGPPIGDSFRKLLATDDEALVEEAVNMYRALYTKEGIFNCSLYDGIPDMLHTLYDAGMCVCLATSKPVAFAERILAHFSLSGLFTVVGGAGMQCYPYTKSQVIESVLAHPALQGKRPVMIGDRCHDGEGAQICKLPFAGVLYGYGDAAELSAYQPVYLAETPRAMAAWLISTDDNNAASHTA